MRRALEAAPQSSLSTPLGCIWGVYGVYMGCIWGVYGVFRGVLGVYMVYILVYTGVHRCNYGNAGVQRVYKGYIQGTPYIIWLHPHLALARGRIIHYVSDPQRRCYDGHQPECHREPLDEFEVPGERGRGGEGGGCVRERG